MGEFENLKMILRCGGVRIFLRRVEKKVPNSMVKVEITEQ
jgi:hypothetical protein